MRDLENQDKDKDGLVNLSFQHEQPEQLLHQSIPLYIREADPQKKRKDHKSMELEKKVEAIYDAVTSELEMYEYLKDLKKENNKRKRAASKNKPKDE